MANPSMFPPVHSSAPSTSKGTLQDERRIHRKVKSILHDAPLWAHCSVVAVGALLAIAVVLISVNWPYRHRKIAPMLEDILTSDVKFSGYHRVYFPRPGFVATGITIRRKTAPAGVPPLGHIDSMMLVGTWTDLIMLRRRVELIDITGFHVIVPAVGSRESKLSFPEGSAKDFTGPDTMIERLVVHNSLLEILRKSDGPLAFPIKQLEIRNFHRGEAMAWAIDMQNAIPHGRILAHGSMGPLKGSAFITTPVSGNFAFTDVQLHDVGEISGITESKGIFKGSLQSMDVEANATTRDFAVTDGKPTLVEGVMQATLYGANGDMDIRSIDLKLRETGIHAFGSIKGDGEKATNLEITVKKGRAEDLLRPFIHDEVPIAGPVALKCHAYLGPPGDGFIARLRVNGAFSVPAEKITSRDTEKSLSAFSERAQGKQKPNTGVESSGQNHAPDTDVLSSLDGSVGIDNGVASTPRLVFRVPGAEAMLGGTFRFHDQAVHLSGELKMDTDISHTSTGFKSFLLKPLVPFFKKKNAGAVIPIAVTGVPGSYKVSQDLSHNK